MKNYTVRWEMSIEAESPREAAEQAWEHMRRPDSIANVFEVEDEAGKVVEVDLDEEGADGE